jgi:hypothetical protein
VLEIKGVLMVVCDIYAGDFKTRIMKPEGSTTAAAE